jgi:hypothetical protein
VLGAGFFYFRPPVLLVSDAAFDALYGVRRAWEKRVELSLRCFRRVKVVPAAENIGADMLVFALEETVQTPYCVLFPYRYDEAAARYAARFPQVPVAVLGGRIQQAPEQEGVLFIPTDVMTDLYRAGRCAAVFAERGGEGRVLFFQDRILSPGEREAFTNGLREQGFEGEPLFLNPGVDYAGPEQAVCAVMMGAAPVFLEQNPGLPVVLFSWLDPDLTARGIKILLDDSPWALAFGAVAMVSRGEGTAPLPSAVLVLRGRLPEKVLLEQIKNVIRSGTP